MVSVPLAFSLSQANLVVDTEAAGQRSRPVEFCSLTYCLPLLAILIWNATSEAVERNPRDCWSFGRRCSEPSIQFALM
jgi:hypothetical protein